MTPVLLVGLAVAPVVLGVTPSVVADVCAAVLVAGVVPAFWASFEIAFCAACAAGVKLVVPLDSSAEVEEYGSFSTLSPASLSEVGPSPPVSVEE